MYPTLSIANYFIRKSLQSGESITPMKLLKLVYIAHGWHLANFNEKPLIGEGVQAWMYGPVIPSLYKDFKQYRDNPITQQKMVTSNDSAVIPMPPDEINAFLDAVWEKYKRFSGTQLSAITHQAGTPWYKVWNEQGGDVRRGAIIPEQVISEHYKSKLKSAKKAA